MSSCCRICSTSAAFDWAPLAHGLPAWFSMDVVVLFSVILRTIVKK